MPTASASDLPAPNPGPTILVVEDEVLIRVFVADYLRDYGFTVLETTDGAGAIELLEAGRPIDLVFTDVTLPGHPDGFALAHWIRKKRPGLPVILTSGKVGEAIAGCKDLLFFAKPCDYSEVVTHIRRLLVF